MSFKQAYLKCVKGTLESWKDKGDRAMAQLNDKELHWSPNRESNSIAIIVKHISGNMISRWTEFLTLDGEKSTRNRDRKFEGGYSSREDLLQAWDEGWNTFFGTLDSLTADDLLKTVYIRGEGHSVLEAIERQATHYVNHIGQILYIGKQIKGES